MQLWRNEGRNWRTAIQSHPSHVASKNIIFPLINIVMTRVSWSRNRPHFELSHTNEVPIVHDSKTLFADRRESPPQPSHFVTVYAGGGVDQFFRINKMRRTTGMNVDRRTKFGEAPRSSGMVKVDVAKKYMPHVFGSETSFPELFGDIREG